LMIIGEAPGAIEDVRGEPFVGPIGDMLNKMLVNVVGLTKSQVYLVNAVKCKVKGGRVATIEEITQCKGHLMRQIKAVSPKLILCLGEAAAKSVVQSSKSVEELRGIWHEFEDIPVLVSFNPAFLLKNPKFKRPVFNDLKLLSIKYDELGGAR
jgi:uracil-DNA glycosylase family 4